MRREKEFQNNPWEPLSKNSTGIEADAKGWCLIVPLIDPAPLVNFFRRKRAIYLIQAMEDLLPRGFGRLDFKWAAQDLIICLENIETDNELQQSVSESELLTVFAKAKEEEIIDEQRDCKLLGLLRDLKVINSLPIICVLEQNTGMYICLEEQNPEFSVITAAEKIYQEKRVDKQQLNTLNNSSLLEFRWQWISKCCTGISLCFTSSECNILQASSATPESWEKLTSEQRNLSESIHI